MIGKEDIDILPKIFNFWNEIKEDDKTKLISLSRTFSLKKNSSFFNSSDMAGIIFLKSGKIRFFISSPEGREITLYSLKKKDIEFYLDCNDEFEFSACVEFIAEENSEVLLIPLNILKILREKYIKIETFLHNLDNIKFMKTISIMQQILFVPLEKRVVTFLENFESSEINITHEEIAKNLGSSREVISRVLKKLEKENYLKLSRNKINLI